MSCTTASGGGWDSSDNSQSFWFKRVTNYSLIHINMQTEIGSRTW
ncbi:unnamed protein product [Acanthoscelides obtectus]|uniref:Uncharacterized protein n=1 Tax=Acanthoscelides obtectus TaxID=200917 RepID=A0A9P0P895_ACAOB|nr:unnamed protein product [Acanthoscelides obtectus]CAK1669371.1 hypothetical protein AOBTE_LOCUS26975 [Acanthoscelides obtectus]